MPLYVYSITAEDHPRHLDGVSGVGSEPTALRTVAIAPCARWSATSRKRSGPSAGTSPRTRRSRSA